MKKPFIQLFRTPNGYYFYDANKSEFQQVTKESYEYLCSLFGNHSDLDHRETDELANLKESGYLSCESNVKEIKHTYSDYLETFLERKLSKITLQVTQDCNLRCRYCIYSEDSSELQRNHSRQNMSWDTAKKSVDFLWNRSVDSKKVNIGFYGGEPLLEFDLVKRVVEYSLKRFSGKKVEFNMTTNGTLLTEDIVDYLQKNDFSLTISIDGPKEINDINRIFPDGTGSYDTVIKCVNMVKEITPEYANKLAINLVLDPTNDFDCINAISLSTSELFELNLMASIVDRDYDNEKVTYSEDYFWKSEYQSFLAILSHFNRYSEDKVSQIAAKALVSVLEGHVTIENASALFATDIPSGPCIPGHLRLFVSAGGKLFPCERVSEISPDMCIGMFDEGFDYTKALGILNIACLTDEECKKCWCIRHCNQCAKKADDGANGFNAKKKLQYCAETREFVYLKLLEYLFFKEAILNYSTHVREVNNRKVGVGS